MPTPENPWAPRGGPHAFSPEGWCANLYCFARHGRPSAQQPCPVPATVTPRFRASVPTSPPMASS